MENKDTFYFSRIIAEALCGGFLFTFAVWVPLAQASMLLNFSLLTLSIIYSVILVVAIGAITFLFRKQKIGFPQQVEYDYSALFMLFLLGIICLVLSFFNSIVGDDPFEISRAVYHHKYPLEPILWRRYLFAIPEWDTVPLIELNRTWNLFSAYLALILHVPFLDVSQRYLPALLLFLLPFVWYLVLSKFSKNSLATVLGVAAILAWCAIDGEPSHAYGRIILNIRFGKIILMTMILPLFAAYSLEFFRKSNWINGFKLFLVHTAAIGLSTSAIFLMSFLSLSLGIAYFFSNQSSYKIKFKNLIFYFCSNAYFVLIFLYLFFGSLINVVILMYHLPKGVSPFQEGVGSFTNHYRGAWGIFSSTSSRILYGFTFLSVILLKGFHRKFLILWILAVIGLFLNSIVYPWIARYVTTDNVYWRVFFIFPYPLVIGIPIALFWQSKKRSVFHAYLGLSFLIMGVFSLHLLPEHPLPPNSFFNKAYNRLIHNRIITFYDKMEFGFFDYQIEPEVMEDLKLILPSSLPGAMLAPHRYALRIPMLTPDFPQVYMHKIWADKGGHNQREWPIISAAKYIGAGDEPDAKEDEPSFEAFLTILDNAKEKNLDLKNIILDASLKKSEETHQALLDRQYQRVKEGKNFLLYIKSESP